MSVKKSSSAFALSLAGGILIILGSIVSLLFVENFQSTMHNRMGGMMYGMMLGMMSGWYLSIPVVAGILVTIAAILLNARPHQSTLWGVIIVIFSIVGLTGMGLSVLGSILGIIGGAIAITKGS